MKIKYNSLNLHVMFFSILLTNKIKTKYNKIDDYIIVLTDLLILVPKLFNTHRHSWVIITWLLQPLVHCIFRNNEMNTPAHPIPAH